MTVIEELPPLIGAYVLVIDTGYTITLKIRGRAHRLSPGRYLYCDSARGPGGIRARVGRHLKKEKSLRWHVDQLTAKGEISNVIVAPDSTECALYEQLSAIPGGVIPIPGFGSSDCRRCPAHLLRVPDKAMIIGRLPLETALGTSLTAMCYRFVPINPGV